MMVKQLNNQYSSPEQVISESYRASVAIWDHTVLPATWHKWTHPT